MDFPFDDFEGNQRPFWQDPTDSPPSSNFGLDMANAEDVPFSFANEGVSNHGADNSALQEADVLTDNWLNSESDAFTSVQDL